MRTAAGSSAAAPTAARAAAAVTDSCDGPPETSPMHVGRRARSMRVIFSLVWMGKLWGAPRLDDEIGAHPRNQRRYTSSLSRARRARRARRGLAKQSSKRWGRAPHRCTAALQQRQQPRGRLRRSQAVGTAVATLAAARIAACAAAHSPPNSPPPPEGPAQPPSAAAAAELQQQQVLPRARLLPLPPAAERQPRWQRQDMQQPMPMQGRQSDELYVHR